MNLFEDKKNEEFDIPDFVEDKQETESVDMSIFNMSDEDIYEDEKPVKENKVKNPNKSTIILCLILIGILIVTATISIIYGIKQHNNYLAINDQLTAIKSKETEYKNEIQENEQKIAELTQKIEDLEKEETVVDSDVTYPAGTKLYITQDGGSQGVRKTASVDADTTLKSDGYPYVLYWGDSVTLLANATLDADGNYWGKIEGGFIRITYDGETWATTDPQ